jgi:hypothetical protein
MLVAICSAKGSPGVSVAALALASMWPSPVVLAECDPAGGDLRTGYLRGEVDTAGRGLGRLAAAARRPEVTDLRGLLQEQLYALHPDGGLLWLPGIDEPGQASVAAASWGRLGQTFAALETAAPTGYDVIADCGRLAAPAPVSGLLTSADLVLLAVRPTVPSVASAAAWLPQLRRHLPEPRRLQLLVIGDGSFRGPEVAAALDLRTAGSLPADLAAAAVLTGAAPTGRNLARAPLMRTADTLARALALRVRDLRLVDTAGTAELAVPTGVSS